MDHWVGGLLDQLEDDGLAESTIVVFWSDHGAGMPRAKRWASESGLREPLIIRWPGVVAPGQERRELVHLMDLAPTMLEVCGIGVPEHMHGRPFLSASGEPLDPNAYVYGGRDRMDEQEDLSRTVRDERYRYIRHHHPDRSFMPYHHYADHLGTWQELRRLAFEEAGQLGRGHVPDRLTPLQRSLVAASKASEELYDVTRDPHETVNLAGDPAHRGALERLRAALDDWTTRYGDLGLVPERELLESWRPGGRPQVTADPVVTRDAGVLTATCPTDGASIGWTSDPPGPLRPADPLSEVTGAPVDDGRRWALCTGPVVPPDDATVWFRAWRLGFEPSDDVAVRAADRR
jgi:uncharacterized sulfatase